MSEKIITLQIEKLAQGGEGIGRLLGQVVFVPYAIPGETVSVKITRERRDYSEGKIEAVVIRSPERRDPPCPVFTRCGGCQLQHLPESAQIQCKSEALREMAARIGKIKTFDLLPTVGSPSPFHYRTRAQLKVHQGAIGFYQRKSHQVVPIDDCPLLVSSIDNVIPLIKKQVPLHYFEEIEIQGVYRGAEFLIVLHGGPFPQKEQASLYEKIRADLPLQGLVAYSEKGRHLVGKDVLLQTFLGQTIRISDRSFSQVNGAVNESLIKTVLDWIAPTAEDRILELYSGAGNFTLFLAEGAGEITAVEENPFAIEDARWNLHKAGLKNVRLALDSAEAAVQKEIQKKETYTQALLDPPREGATEPVLRGLARLGAMKIFYISCDPATFARDLRVLSGAGYEMKRLQPFDMFPQTGRLELLAEFVKI